MTMSSIVSKPNVCGRGTKLAIPLGPCNQKYANSSNRVKFWSSCIICISLLAQCEVFGLQNELVHHLFTPSLEHLKQFGKLLLILNCWHNGKNIPPTTHCPNSQSICAWKKRDIQVQRYTNNLIESPTTISRSEHEMEFPIVGHYFQIW